MIATTRAFTVLYKPAIFNIPLS